MKKLVEFLKETISVAAEENRVRMIFRVLAVGMAIFHAWAAIISQSMNADGISYLDIGDAYFRGDWENAINPVWPPLYSWILGLENFVFKPSMEWEFPSVHMINFVIFLFAMACFEFMWGKLRYFSPATQRDGLIRLPGWAWWAIGYSLFIWSSLSLIQIWAVTPDLLMAALLYLAAGLVIQIRNDSHRLRNFIYLGLILGLGYLAKTFMFSMAVVFLGLSLLLIERKWSSLAKVVLATTIFLAISLPFIILISVHKGKFTMGEAGTVTYIRYVHGIPFPHWQGDPVKGIMLAHPSRLINQSPPIYEFGGQIGGTYPISTDPSYWLDGIEMPFNIRDQIARVYISCLFYLDLFFQKQGVLLASVIALYAMAPRQKYSPNQFIEKWTLVIPAVAAFGLYGAVLVSGRYIGAFVLLFWADILANIRLADKDNNRSWIKVLSAIAVGGLLVNIVLFNLDGFIRLNPSIQSDIGEQSTSRPTWPGEVAQELHQLGVNEGDQVAVIGYGFDSFWARLAKVKIVAEMLDTQAADFWYGDETLRQNVLMAFASTGAEAVIAENVPAKVRMDGWHQVGDSNYTIYLLED